MSTTKPFDFDAFIADIKPSECTVRVYAVDHRSEILNLEKQLDTERQVESAGVRFGAKPKSTQLAQRVKKLRDEMDKSAIEFRFKALHPDRLDHYVSAAEIARVDEGEDAVSADDAMRESKYEQLAEQAVYPPLDKEQWKATAEMLGAPRFAALVNAATQHTLESVTLPPFSPGTLATLAQKDSDES